MRCVVKSFVIGSALQDRRDASRAGGPIDVASEDRTFTHRDFDIEIDTHIGHGALGATCDKIL
jgi:hypothetical protein